MNFLTRIGKYVLPLALCVLASGCFPYRQTIRPGLEGSVVSADTRLPLSGASISLGTNSNPMTISAADGSFSVRPTKIWQLWVFPEEESFLSQQSYPEFTNPSPLFADIFPEFVNTSPETVSVRHEGYQTKFVAFYLGGGGKKAMVPLGVISLKPLSPQSAVSTLSRKGNSL